MSSSIFEWLQTQPSAVIDKLYGCQVPPSSSSQSNGNTSQAPFVCKAVFQSLSALAKNYLIRLLFIEKSVTCQELGHWVSGGYRKPEHLAAVEELIKLNILKEDLDMMGTIDDMEVEEVNHERRFPVIDSEFEEVTEAPYSVNAFFDRASNKHSQHQKSLGLYKKP